MRKDQHYIGCSSSLQTSSETNSLTQKNHAEPKPDEGPSVQVELLTEIEVRYLEFGTWSPNLSRKSDDTPHW